MISQSELMSVYRETVRPLYGYVSRRTGGQRDLTEDIVQETYVRAWQSWHRHEVDNHLAWLKTVAHNLLANHFRRLKLHSLDEAGFDPACEAPLDTPDNVAWVQLGLTRIKKNYSQILEMFYFDEKNLKEISSRLKITERTVEGRMHRARLALRKQLQKLAKSNGGLKK
jgi:RNA polymerase sigma-70 factor (ECF subfamily)